MTVLQTASQRVSGAEQTAAPPIGLRRSRSTTHMLLGAVLVVVCALGFAITALPVDPRTAVLAVASHVHAGHTDDVHGPVGSPPAGQSLIAVRAKSGPAPAGVQAPVIESAAMNSKP